MNARRILVVQHQDDCPPARFGTWITEAGGELDVRRPYLGDELPVDLDRHSGVLVLGGSMNALDEDVTPWLARTKDLIRQAVGNAVPLLGICLGHQIAVDALGGVVASNPAGTQRGLLEHGWNSAVVADPLFAGRPARAAHWNSDIAVVPPDGSAVLARAPGGEVQALRFGEVSWGIQSHPEVDEVILRAWAEEEWSEGAADPVGVDAFLAEVVARREELQASWRPVAAAFVGLCGPVTRR